ncbi:MAG TPA: hypothetical protein DCE23_04260 [Firmicutes bacterium]|nr:hypothetical protein [Bacillota bacterium]
MLTIEEIQKMNCVSVKDAAEFIGATPSFIRQGLKDKRLPFGTAVQQSPTKWTFNISPGLLIEYKTGRIAFKNYLEKSGDIFGIFLDNLKDLNRKECRK